MMNGYSYKDLVMPNSFVCENVKATLGRMAKKSIFDCYAKGYYRLKEYFGGRGDECVIVEVGVLTITGYLRFSS